MPKKLPDDVHYERNREMFQVALSGIIVAFQEEKNFRFDCFVALLVILAGFFLHVSRTDWCVLMLCIGWVLMAEIMNTAIENVVDFICPHYDLKAKKIKDLSSGAVLVSCIIASIIGILIFLPYLF